MTHITPQPGIMDIDLYQGGKAHLDGVTDPLKLSSNENPLGASPKAIKAVQDAAFDLNRYPSSDHAALRGAIGQTYDIPADQIICGAGSDELIAFLCQCFAGPGDEVIHTQYGFAMYAISAKAAGATPIEVSETSRTVDVDAILAACTKKTRLVFIANPSNPTGTFIDLETVARLADGLPEQALLVLDGAYTEYVQGYDGGAQLVSERSNIFMTRTFSKIYGLGALRVGWGYGPSEIIDVMNRVRGPFNVSATGLAAAEAAVKDQEFVERCRHDNARGRAWLRDQLQRMGLGVDRSYANFLLVRFADQETAQSCNDFLQTQGLIVRQTGGYQLPNALRITVGDEAGCRRVSHAIKQFLESTT